MGLSVLGFLLKITGLQKIWDLLDGYKVYAAGFASMFTGIGLMAAAAATLLTEIAALTGWQADLLWIQNIRHDGAAIQFGAGWAALIFGLKTVGERHAQQKLIDSNKALLKAPVATPATQPSPMPEPPAEVKTEPVPASVAAVVREPEKFNPLASYRSPPERLDTMQSMPGVADTLAETLLAKQELAPGAAPDPEQQK